MADNRKPDDDRDNGWIGNVLGNDLKNRVIAGLVAVIAGGFGTAGVLNLNPPRPNPYTSIDAAMDREAMRQWVLEQLRHHDGYQARDRERMERLDARVRRLEVCCAIRDQ